MANSNKILYDLIRYYTQDNLVFDNIYSHFFNPLYASDLYSNSTLVTVSKKFRIDLAISNITNDFSLIKIVNILNEKPYGIFSYNENDIVYVPSTNIVTYINSVNDQLVIQKDVKLNISLQESLKKSYDNLKENLSKLDTSQIFNYISETDQIYLFLENDEYVVRNKFKGLI